MKVPDSHWSSNTLGYAYRWNSGIIIVQFDRLEVQAKTLDDKVNIRKTMNISLLLRADSEIGVNRTERTSQAC